MENKGNIISENDNSTVLTEYNTIKRKETSYQSEAELENEFIKILQEQSYEYLNIKNENDLINNLRKQLEKLNKIRFTDKEWNDLFNNFIANSNDGIVEKTRKIQEDYKYPLQLENGELRNIYLLYKEKQRIHDNFIQVINQYEVETDKRKNRYDVTILINGLPMVHIELKRRGVELRQAFNQIERYQRDSFWYNSGLYNYIQIFVISNGTFTKYYSNTTRYKHLDGKRVKKSNSFEFTSYWADQNNNGICDLEDFARTFLNKRTLLNIITKYCILTSEEDLLVMRPYQITATEKIINKIDMANNYNKYGTIEAGGYIWHTTGSGKTLTSFKTAQIASNLEYIDKVIFVVDRKDLDYQTMKEYDRFKKGCANSNANTKILKGQLEDNKSKIIITTIQKLDSFIKKNKSHKAFNKKIVFIFDECHRSQFGDNNASGIVLLKPYKDYYYGYEDDQGKEFKGYKELIKELKEKFPLGTVIIGEQNQKEFIKLYGAILKVTNILDSFDQFKSEQLLSERDVQDYHSTYQDIYEEFRRKSKVEATDITEDIVFEMELIKQIEVNIDYILALVKKYHESNMEDKEVLITINKAIMSSPDLRNKKDLILSFIDSLNTSSDVYADFEKFMNSKKKEELDRIIKEENLDEEETYKFVKKSFERGNIETEGLEISSILPPMDMFSKDKSRLKKKNEVIDRLLNFFDKFFSITNNSIFTKNNVEYKIDEDSSNSDLMVAEDNEDYKTE